MIHGTYSFNIRSAVPYFSWAGTTLHTLPRASPEATPLRSSRQLSQAAAAAAELRTSFTRAWSPAYTTPGTSLPSVGLIYAKRRTGTMSSRWSEGYTTPTSKASTPRSRLSARISRLTPWALFVACHLGTHQLASFCPPSRCRPISCRSSLPFPPTTFTLNGTWCLKAERRVFIRHGT